MIGSALSSRAPVGFLRTALGLVLVGSGIVTIQKGDATLWPIAALVAGVGLALIIAAPRWFNRRRQRDEPPDAGGPPAADSGDRRRDRSGDLTPEAIG